MWFSGKKRNEFSSIQVFPKEKIQIITHYADNEMYLQELRICVSVRDWFLLQREPFFQELVRYVKGLEE